MQLLFLRYFKNQIMKSHNAIYGLVWPFMRRAQLVQKNQPNESTVAMPHLPTTLQRYYISSMYVFTIYVLLLRTTI